MFERLKLALRVSDGGRDFIINKQAGFSYSLYGFGATTFGNKCEHSDLRSMHKTCHAKADKLYSKLDDFERTVFGQAIQ